MKRILYLLVNEQKSSFKIGVTDDIESRHARLSCVWGKFDLDSSRMVAGSRRDIAGLEATLHYLLDRWRICPSNKSNGYSEWFSIDCFDKAIELISSIGQIRGMSYENIILENIFSQKNKKSPNNKAKKYPNIPTSFEEIKSNWPDYEQSTLDFRDRPNSKDEWLWTIDSRTIKISPFEFLCFQKSSRSIALATAKIYLEDSPWIQDIVLSKSALDYMGAYDGFSEEYEFFSENFHKLSEIAQIARSSDVNLD